MKLCLVHALQQPLVNRAPLTSVKYPSNSAHGLPCKIRQQNRTQSNQSWAVLPKLAALCLSEALRLIERAFKQFINRVKIVIPAITLADPLS